MALLAELALEEAGEVGGVEDGDGAAFDRDQVLFTEFGECSAECFADRSEFGGEDAFCGFELQLGGRNGIGVVAMAQEPVCEAGFHVLEREVFELGDEGSEAEAHGAEHPECEVGLLTEDFEEAGFLDMENLGGFQGAGIGGVSLAGGECSLGEGVSGAKEVDDLFFAGAVDAVDIDGPGLDDEEAGGGVAFVEEVFIGLEVSDAGDGGDPFEVIGGQFAEEVAATQGIEEGGLAEVRKRACHLWLGGRLHSGVGGIKLSLWIRSMSRDLPKSSGVVGPVEGGTPCLRRTVMEAMEADRRLEAVRFERGVEAMEVATLGLREGDSVAGGIRDRIGQLQAGVHGEACHLLEGEDECGDCPIAGQVEGRLRVQVESEGGRVTFSRVTCPTAPRFWRWSSVPFPRFEPRQVVFSGEEDYDREWRVQLAAAAVCGVLGVAGWLVPSVGISLALYLLAYVAGAWFTVGEIRERLEAGVLDVHFLMLAVAAGSAAIGAFAEGAVLLFLFSLSGALEHYAMGRTQREIRSLFRDAPKVASRLDEAGQEVLTPVEELLAGMRLRVRPGEQFSVDGEIRSGETAADESTLTGEAVPVDKREGDTVLAGTMNLWGSVEVVVLRAASESALQKVVRLIREAQHLKAPAQRFTDRFSTGYTYAVLGLSLGMFLYWWLVRGMSPWGGEGTGAFYRAMTLLVVSSPCALVLSIPSAVLAAIAWAAKRGILFRGGAAVERLAGVKVVAMDKTGTLTTGELRVEGGESYPAGEEERLLQWAYALEQHSQHPLARAILRHGKHAGWRPLEVDRFESLNGLGVTGWIGGERVWLGRREWVCGLTGWSPPAEAEGEDPGTSEIWLWSERLAGRIRLRDDLRPTAQQLVRDLLGHGLEVVVLTGDRKAAAEALRQQVGLTDLRTDLKPEDKVGVVRGFVEAGRPVAMIGDGVNDAPSLAAADVGVAMGARGADAALEQAEVVLMQDRLENFLAAFELSRRARRIIRQNLAISLGTVVLLVAFALAGGIPLTLGVLGHEGSTVVVVLNSLRLLFSADTARTVSRATA